MNHFVPVLAAILSQPEPACICGADSKWLCPIHKDADEGIARSASTEVAESSGSMPSARLRVNYAFELIRMGCTVTMFSLDEMNAVVQRAMLGEFDKDIWQPLLADHKERIVADAAPKPQPEPLSTNEEQRRSFVTGNCNISNPKVTREVVNSVVDEIDTTSTREIGGGYCAIEQTRE